MAINYQSSFNSGELSGRMNGRSDLDVYKNGCSRLENFYVLPQGGVERRTGTEFVGLTDPAGEAGTPGNARSRLLPFVFSSSQNYIVEFGDEYITVHDGDTVVTTFSGTPYTDADIDEIDMRQRFDIMYIHHPDFPIYELKRTDLAPTFTFTELAFDFPPLQEENDEDVFFDLTFSGTAWNTTAGTSYSIGDVVLFDGALYKCVSNHTSNASFTVDYEYGFWIATNSGVSAVLNAWDAESGGNAVNHFTDEDVGSYFYIKNPRNGRVYTQNSIVGDPKITNYSSEISSGGPFGSGGQGADNFSGALNVSYSKWTFNLTLNNQGCDVTLQRSTDSGTTWEDYVFIASEQYPVTKSFTYSSPSTEGGNTWVRISYSNFGGGTSTTANLFISDIRGIDGLVRVDSVDVSGETANVTVVSDVQQELSAGMTGTIVDMNPTRTKKWNKSLFSSSSGGARAMTFYEDRMWLAGSANDPSTIYSSVSGDYYNFQTGDTADMGIVRIPDSPEEAQWLIGRKRMILGTEGGAIVVNSVNSNELIDASNIVTASQAVFGASSVPAIEANDAVVYAERSNKKLRELIYNDTEENYRSSDINILNDKILTEGVKELFLQQQPDQIIWAVDGNGDCACLTYERVQEVVGWSRFITDGAIQSACKLPSSTSEDEVWMCVKRGDKYTIEKSKPRGDMDWYVDSGVEASLTGSDVEGLDHLEGMTVRCVVEGDGWIVNDGTYVVASGKITPTTQGGTKYLVGLDYDSILRTMPIEPTLVSKLPNSRVKGAVKCIAEFETTTGGSVREQHKVGEVLDEVEFSGELPVPIASDWTREKIIEIKQHLPYPMTILSLAVWTEVKGG